MRILLATDGTVHSQAALDALTNFNLASGDEVKIVSVVDMAVPLTVDMYGGYVPATAEIERAARENAQRILEESSREIKDKLTDRNVSVSTEALFGSPESRIVETADGMNADLIIVGSHGYNRWERLLLGSVSDSVVHHAPCSVLVVRTPKK